MHATKPSRTAIWVALLRGVARFEKPALVNDSFADALLPLPYRPILDVARSLPRASGLFLGAIDVVSLGMSRHMALRTRAIDDAIEGAVQSGARQLVLLGAGLDARAWRMNALRACTVFEVDHPSTQAYKRARTGDLSPSARRVTFVDVDFERQDLGTRLREAGHDRMAPSVFVWEGVTMYLTLEAIEATLAAVSRAAAPGSTLAVTYHSGLHIAPLAFVVRAVREPFVSTFAPAAIAGLFAKHGFTVTQDESDPEWRQRYCGATTPFAVERLAVATRNAENDAAISA
jgi:methyltransferase (TIGR00027 family)